MSDNLQLLSTLEPQPLWRYFAEICSIPHCSKQEDQIRNWLRQQADDLKLPWKEDSVGNIVISRPAAAGMENAPGIILQSHMDMVCEKNSGSDHNFDTDPLKLIIEDNILTACDTTLGADNGVGAASALALLADSCFPTGPLEALFTVDEETGLTGAQALEPGFITGDYLLNLDSEESWVLCVGCAGGKDSQLVSHYDFIPGGKSKALLIKVDGLSGGHSGVDIHTGRGNAVKILTDLLSVLGEKMNWQLVDFHGGTKHNAIPREAASLIVVDEIDLAIDTVQGAFQQQLEIYQQRDSGLQIIIEQVETDKSRLNPAASRQVAGLLTSLPHGVLEMSAAIEGLVETSSNLAIVNLSVDLQEILLSHRSSCAASLERLATRTREISRAFGVDVTQGNGYPGWQPNPDSPLLARSLDLYRELFNEEPEVLSIHAGLECGLIGSRFPELDMIAIGPTIRNPHTPDELVEIDSVERYWRFLCQLVQRLGTE
jgi:dipeptidase D